MARNVTSLEGFGMDYLEDIVAHSATAVDSDERCEKEVKIKACIAKLQQPAPTSKQCKYCDRAPCIMDEHYDRLMTMGSDMEDDFDNKEIRYAMY
jgi:hypothetical protein